MKRLPCRPDGKVIGHVAGDVFTKRVKRSKHMLRAPRGWALDAPTLAELRALGVVTVAITDTEADVTYTAPLTEFGTHGVAFNRGAGPQVCLPVGYWRVNGQPPALTERQRDPNAGVQLSLFPGPGTGEPKVRP